MINDKELECLIKNIKTLSSESIGYDNNNNEINSHKVLVSISKPKKYSELMYGQKWRIPEKEWSKEKLLKVKKLFIRYKIKNQKVKDLWIRRGDINLYKKGDDF